jgi:hypothetical protein
MAGTFPPSSLCIALPDIPTIDEICFPGGFCLSYIWDAINKIPHGSDMCLDFFSQIGPAMAPMKPFFDILDTVLALFRCLKAIPEAILSLDPSELLNCFPALAKMIDQLLKLIPYLSLPKMVKAILHNLATLIRSVANDLNYIKSQLQRIADMIDRAADLNDVKMNGFLVCAQATMNDGTMSTAEALKGIGRIILLVNILMGLFGGPEIPCFGELMANNIAEGIDKLIELLVALAELLDDIADMIPDPDLVLTLALGEQRC